MRIDRSHFPALSAEDLRPEYFPPSPVADPALYEEIKLWLFVPKAARKLNAEYREARLLEEALSTELKRLNALGERT